MGISLVIAERYRLDEQIGAGGMGVIWRATDLVLDRRVALKRSQAGDRGQVRREAQIGAGLLHPNVIAVFDVVLHGGEQWLVMEYLPSRSVERVVEEDGPLPEGVVRHVGVQVADAVAAMHARGIVHRDIKPGNVLLADGGVAKLTDLGIARWAEVTQTSGAHFVGTVGYLAPEVAGGHEAGPPADVFALGATLYAAVEGRSPWGTGADGPFAQLNRAISGRPDAATRAADLAPVLALLMSADPADRPTAEEAGRMLAGDAVLPAPVRPARSHVRAARPGRRRNLRVGASSAGVVAAVALAALGTSMLTRELEPAPVPASTLGGDPATADPCAAISTDALAPYGRPFVDPELGNFGRCVVTTDLVGGVGQVQSTLDFMSPDRYPARPLVPGRMSEIDRPERVGNTCRRSESLADGNRVVIDSTVIDSTVHASTVPELCAMSESLLADVNQELANGPLPRRTTASASASLARVDACGLLSAVDTTAILGRAVAADREFGNWGCVWEADPRTVRVSYTREWPVEHDPDVHGSRSALGDRLVIEMPGSNPNGAGRACTVWVVHRSYTPALPVLRGTPDRRDEIVALSVEDTGVSDPGPLCALAMRAASDLVARLPRPGA